MTTETKTRNQLLHGLLTDVLLFTILSIIHLSQPLGITDIKNETQCQRKHLLPQSQCPAIIPTENTDTNQLHSADYATSFKSLEYYAEFEMKLYDYFQNVLFQSHMALLEISPKAQKQIKL